MHLMINSIADIRKYGLPFFESSPIGSVAYNITERAYARFYWLDDMRFNARRYTARKSRLEDEWETHTLLLGKWLLDYIIQISCGEARHWQSNCYEVKACVRCAPFRENYSGKGDGGRTSAADTYIGGFSSYDSILESLNHLYWDHAWKKGMGGWMWGNVAWIGHSLNQGFKEKNVKMIAKWIDIAAAVTHNGGSFMHSKYEWYSFDQYLMYRVLWAKFHSQPCCFETLDNVWKHGGEIELKSCVHAIGKVRASGNVSKQQALRPGMIPKWICNHCQLPKEVSKLDTQGVGCKSFCINCYSCNCHHSKTWNCVRCAGNIKAGKPHPRCHSCSSKTWMPAKGTYFIDDIEIEMKHCYDCGQPQYVELPEGSSMKHQPVPKNGVLQPVQNIDD